ncbi:MAG: MBOAT family protein, partial [Schleiferiaceae bacterium]|nr:MBOAT family protein [Schleiferiaceae bacterium]
SPSLFTEPYIKKAFMIFVILFFISIEWLGRDSKYALEKFGLKWPKWIRWSFYILLVVMMYALMTEPQEFIYFQF